MSKRKPRITIAPDTDGTPDNVTIAPVEMFRMERMDSGYIWLRCYLHDGTQVDFNLTSSRKIHIASERDGQVKKGKNK